MTSAIPVQCSTNWAIKPRELVLLWVHNIPVDDEAARFTTAYYKLCITAVINMSSNTTSIGSCILKASAVKCWSIHSINTLHQPSINTPSMPRLTLDQYSIDILDIDSQVSFVRFIWSFILELCRWSASQVPIRILIEYQSRCRSRSIIEGIDRHWTTNAFMI